MMNQLTTLDKLEATVEAYKILNAASLKTACGPRAIWNKLYHAQEALNTYTVMLLKDSL